MKLQQVNFKKEFNDFSIILWDQIILSIVFTLILYFTKEDYNFQFKSTDSELFKLWKCWHFSIVTQYTVGYGYVYPINIRGEIVNSFHIIISYYLLARDMTRALS